MMILPPAASGNTAGCDGDPVFVSKSIYLYKDARRRVARLIVEPGTFLKCAGKKDNRIFSVYTPTGILCEVAERDVHIFKRPLPGEFVYIKSRFTGSSKHFSRKTFTISEFYPVLKKENGLNSEYRSLDISVADARYDFKNNRYTLIEDPITIANGDMDKVNIVNQECFDRVTFDKWEQIQTENDNGKRENFTLVWGRGKHLDLLRDIPRNIDIDENKLNPDDLRNWMSTRGTIYNNDINLIDDRTQKHRTTLWKLVDDQGDIKQIVAIDRTLKKSRYNYTFGLHIENMFEDIEISHDWVRRKSGSGIKKGDKYPVKLENMSDYSIFVSTINQELDSIDKYSPALRDLIMRNAAEIK